MKPDILIKLVGPTGDKEQWRIRFRRQKHYGETDWIHRVVIINSRLRNPATIEDTLLHEIAHVTAGQNASEEFVENFELNFRLAKKAIGIS